MADLTVRFKAARHYVGIGFMNVGDTKSLEKSLAQQFIAQGFAEEVEKPRPRPTRVAAKTEDEAEDE